MGDGVGWLSNVVTYVISVGLIIGDLLHWLNSNAAACGVLLGVLTYCTNVFFQVRNSKAIAKSHIERRKG